MIISALAEAAKHLVVPLYGYQDKKTPWAITLSPDGDLVSLVPTSVVQRGKDVPLTQPVPAVQRSGSAPKPQLACDTGFYSLGIGKPPKKASDPYEPTDPNADPDDQHQSWITMIKRWSSSYPDDVGAQAISKWLDRGKPGLSESLPGGQELRSLATGFVWFRLAGSEAAIHRSSAAVSFWQSHVNATKSHTSGLCSACGKRRRLAATFPAMVPIRVVEGSDQTTGVALTSANFSSASRGVATKGLATAPVCLDCAVASVSALTALAEDRDHHWRGAESRTIWWTKSGQNPTLFNLLNSPPPPEEVRRLFDQVRAGMRVTYVGDLDDQYYALTYSGRQARLVIRAWATGTLRDVAEHLSDYFDDSEMQDAWNDDQRWQPLWRLAQATGAPRSKGGKTEHDLPQFAEESILRAALTGSTPQASLLSACIQRSRAEAGSDLDHVESRSHARASLIRLILSRSPNLIGISEVPTPQLDTENIAPAYVCGRLFAQYESLQRAALGSDVNATIADRQYSKAMLSPVTVYPSLDRLSKAHLKKLRSDGKTGTAVALQDQITELISRLKAFPVTLSVPQQGLWVLGYHQQRATNIQAAQDHIASRNANDSSSNAN